MDRMKFGDIERWNENSERVLELNLRDEIIDISN